MQLSRILVAGALLLAPSVSLAATGDYKEVSCSSQAFFGTNSCNQCFNGGSITVGQKLTGLYDSWTNKNQTEQVIYKDEQVKPSLVNLGGNGTSFLSTPSDEDQFWTFGSEIIFTPESGTASGAVKRDVFSLKAGKTVRVMDSAFGANYQLEKTDQKNGASIALVKFPINYHDVSDQTGKPGILQKHLECVAFSANIAAAPSAPAQVAKVPPQATKVKTGAADTFLFVGLALLLALAFMFGRKRRTN